MKVRVDPEDLTLGEVDEIEEIAGCALGRIDWEAPPARVTLALVYVYHKRDDPAFTLEAARKVKLSELEYVTPPQLADGEV
jgi:hypothetical protein